MKLIGTMPVRNESWCLGLSARVALMWTDELVILNHASTDATVDIIADLQAEHPGRVHLISVPESQWNEMQHRQMMLVRARERGATHIAIVDADEVLTGNLLPLGGDCHWAAKCSWPPLDGSILHLPGYNLRCGLTRYHANGIWGNRLFSTAFKEDPRLSWAGDKHHQREPMGLNLQGYRPIQHGQGGVMHLWGASERRLIAKHALYKVRDTIRWPDKREKWERMYSWAIKGEPGHRSYGTPENWTYADVPPSWWAPYAGLMKHLDLDAEPWQEAETRRLVQLHGAETFKGLDLFGVG